ncbi:P63C domain-containing protein [Paludisphaera soli]|uniref:P63C domain-containing protein n=1 Tax=Paludisphaera soli TaxID=2712865 RepID=UPI0013EB5B02|nr:P63C domain-containing protein [Paludisphaera soli]
MEGNGRHDGEIKPITASELGAKGGKARALSLTSEERSQAARRAVEARWEKAGVRGALPAATHGSNDHPLKIGEIEIPCYVLNDGRRVIVQSGAIRALGMVKGGSSHKGGTRLAKFVSGERLKPYASKQLLDGTQNPIEFQTPSGKIAFGFEATILTDICDAVLEARKAGMLQAQQEHIAERCEMLVRAFARVGIIALVDEATGYQYDRPRRDLEEHLKKFLSESLRRWVRTFPADYFKHLCRLRGVELRPDMRLPQYFGVLTNNLIYRRIAPGLLKRLKERRSERGNPHNKLHSWLSQDVGVPEAMLHLGLVIGLMKLHTDYDAFEKQLDQVAPIYAETPGLFDDPKDWEPR